MSMGQVTIRPHYSRLLDIVGYGVLVMNAKGVVMYSSPRAFTLLELPPQNVYGASFEVLFNAEMPALEENAEHHMTLQRAGKQYQLTLVRYDDHTEIALREADQPPAAASPQSSDLVNWLGAVRPVIDTFFHNTHLSTYLIDADYTIVESNGTLLQDANGVLTVGRSLKDYEDIALQIDCALRGDSVSILMRFGSGIYEAAFNPVLQEGSKIHYVYWMLYDVTEREKLLQESYNRESIYRLLARQLPDTGVLLFDRQMRYIVAEGQELERIGYGRSYMEGRTMFEALTPEDAKALEPYYRATLEGKSQRIERTWRDAMYLLTFVPVPDLDGTIQSGIVMIQNITSFRSIEQALRQKGERLTALLRAVPDVMLVLNRDGRLIEFQTDEFLNMAAILFPTQQVGITLAEAGFPPALLEDFMLRLRQAFETGKEQVVSQDLPLVETDSSISFEARIVPLNDAEALVTVRDTSELTWMQQLLSNSMQRFMILDIIDRDLGQNTLDVKSVMALALDLALLMSEAHSGFIAMLDEQGEWLPVVHKEDYDGAALNTYVRDRRGYIAEVMDSMESKVFNRAAVTDEPPLLSGIRSRAFVPMPLGNRAVGVLVLEAVASGTLDNDKAAFLQLAMARFTTSLENARLKLHAEKQVAELTDLYERVSKLEQLKTDMIRIASHDLRTPLMLIVNYLNLVRENLGEGISPQTHEYLTAIRDAAERMRQMTGEILSLERLEVVANDKQPNLIDLRDLAQNAFSDHWQSARLKSQTLTLDISPEPLIVSADDVQIREAMGNLISNAIKYTPEGGIVQVTLRAEGERGAFRVADSGSGIPTHLLEKLFQPFFRLPQNRSVEGTGLGLTLVKSIIDRHRGQLIVESEMGKGSVFGFSMALHKR